MGTRQPPRHTVEGAATRRGSHSGGHRHGWTQNLGTHPDGHTSRRRTRRRRAHTGPRERTPGPPQRRGHTLTRSRAHTRAHTGTPARLLPGRCGPRSPSPGGAPGPAPPPPPRSAPWWGRARGGGAVPRGRLPPASRPPSGAAAELRPPRRLPPEPAATTAARGRGLQPEGAGGQRGGCTPQTPAPGPSQTPFHCGAAGPPPTSPQPHLQPRRLPKRPPDHAPTSIGTRDLPIETADHVPIPRGTSDHALPPLRTQNMFYSHPGPQTTSYSPW